MDVYFKRILLFFLLFIISCFPQVTSAWSNYFRFINNFNHPISFDIHPTLANIKANCGKDNHFELSPHSISCEIEFETAKENWHSSPGNAGIITVTNKNDTQSYCQYQYNYSFTLIPYNYMDLRSENISLISCHGNMIPAEITIVNNHNKALATPISQNLILELNKEKSLQSMESISQADCGGLGGDNCMIFSANMDKNYVPNGSTLSQSLWLQLHLDQNEPLNFSQFIGTHNSMVGPLYTSSTSQYNTSYSDPDNNMRITQQLESGVRFIELDVVWNKGLLNICHNHISQFINRFLCEGNVGLDSGLNEIKTWIEKNPNEFLLLYLDVNAPLKNHVNDLDSELKILEPYIFTPAMAEQYFQIGNNTLPAFQLTKNKLLHYFKKNIIITNDNDVENLKFSRYVFVKVQNSLDTPLEENGVDTLMSAPQSSSNDPEKKYEKIKTIYKNDKEHYNLFRLNGDRTTCGYIAAVGDKSPSEYINYFTTSNLPKILAYPLNIISLNMLGYACNSTECDSYSTDPRFYSLLWSWELGYPLNNGGHIAYINPKSNHFENEIVNLNETYSALCVKPANLNGPYSPLNWYLVDISFTNLDSIDKIANLACERSGGRFVVPTTSYWMQEALSSIRQSKKTTVKVFVNYKYTNDQWIPNALESETTGRSLTQ